MCQCANIAVYQHHRRTTEHSPITEVTLGGDHAVSTLGVDQEVGKAGGTGC